MHGAIWGAISLNGRPLRKGLNCDLSASLRGFARLGTAHYQSEAALLGRAESICEAEASSLIQRDPADQVLMVSSARLDARDALTAALGVPLSTPDDQLLFRAYSSWGQDCAQRVIGDWSFARLKPAEHELVLARDPIGVRPLYFAETAGTLVFASTIAALRSVIPGTAIAPDALFCALGRRPWPAHQTIFSGIRRLPPGSMLRVRGGSWEEVRYWDWHTIAAAPSPVRSDAEWADMARRLMQIAVSDRMRAGSNVGVPLSGGLDSSSIVSLAARVSGCRVITVSAILPDDISATSDERNYQAAVLRTCPGVVHHSITGQASRIFGPELEAAFAQIGSPVNVFHAMDRLIGETLGECGATTMLSGYGGDFALSNAGNQALAELLARGQLRSAARLVTSFVKTPGAKAHKELLRAMRLLANPRRWASLRAKGALVDLLARGHRTMEETGQARATMGIETSYPLLDRRLMEFCLTVPPDQFRTRGMRRSLMRRAMHGILPDEVTFRTSKGAYFPYFPYIFAEEADDAANHLLRLAQTTLLDRTERRILAHEALAAALIRMPNPETWTSDWSETNLARATILARFVAWQKGESLVV
jgi:asparagine synthase (glutamine-hydrolysing)